VPSRRRHFLDGAYAVALYGLAVLIGYAVLAPDQLRLSGPRAVNAPPKPPAVGGKTPELATPALPGTGTIDTPRVPERRPHAEARLTPEQAPVSAPANRGLPPEPEVPPALAPPPGDTRPWPSPVRGRVLDEGHQPLMNAAVVGDGVEVLTGADGSFAFDHLVPGSRLLVKMPGYAKVTIEPTSATLEVALRPYSVKAAYLTYFGVNDKRIRGRVLDLIERTELNGVVIDVKGDRGWILYPTQVPRALEVGAQGPATMRDFDRMMADLKARGIYTIARIVTFKDNLLATGRPDLAIIDGRTGKPWVDRENLAWVDPFREEVWAYNIAIAKEAVAKGFDEVQFDYVRFPTDGKLGAARYARPNNKTTRLPTIAAFLERARREIGPTGAFVAADIFGYTAFNDNDTDIGQRIEELAPHLDYVCPMVYPSGYHLGIPGFRNPVTHPYEVVHESVRLIRQRSASSVVRVRPWLQDFRDYAFDRRVFGVSQVQAQVRAADEAGSAGWMLWNPRNDYTGAALRPKGGLAASGPAGPASAN
jgi:hypothetical protein